MKKNYVTVTLCMHCFNCFTSYFFITTDFETYSEKLSDCSSNFVSLSTVDEKTFLSARIILGTFCMRMSESRTLRISGGKCACHDVKRTKCTSSKRFNTIANLLDIRQPVIFGLSYYITSF